MAKKDAPMWSHPATVLRLIKAFDVF